MVNRINADRKQTIYFFPIDKNRYEPGKPFPIVQIIERIPALGNN